MRACDPPQVHPIAAAIPPCSWAPPIPTAHRHGVAVPGERESECAESKQGRLQRPQIQGVTLRSLLFRAIKGCALSIATKPRFASGRGSAGASLRIGGANGTSRRRRDSTHCTSNSNSTALTSPQCGTTSTASAAPCLLQAKRSASRPEPSSLAAHSHICTGTVPALATSAPGLVSQPKIC